MDRCGRSDEGGAVSLFALNDLDRNALTFVAQITRTSACIVAARPERSNCCSCMT
jgi:hypothetical protein